jgi:hypothetical protein
MATTKSGGAKGKAKTSFTPERLQSLINKVNKNPELLEGDWRELVGKHFPLNAAEKKGLEGTPAAKVKKIQKFLREAAAEVRGGKALTGKLVKRPVKERTHLVFDVDVDFAAAKKTTKAKK